MAKVAVVITYDDTEAAPHPDLAIQVVEKVQPLFVGKQNFEVHLANGRVALTMIHILSDRGKVG